MQRLHFLGMFVFSVGLMGLTLACQPQAPPDTRAADERAIRAAVVEWVKAENAKDVERTLSFLTDDASLLPPNAPIVTGKEAMGALLAQSLERPGFAVSAETTQVEVSRTSDLAYAHGTYELTLHDPKGNPVTDRGKWVAVWKKQPDGAWKAVIEVWNSDLPLPAAE